VLEEVNAEDGARLEPEQVVPAITAGDFVYEDGSTQVFDTSGATTYVEAGRETYGEWYLDSDGRFCSFWPPSYRACYDLYWIVEQGSVAGLRFTETGRGAVFTGRYR
jgi:hypothetical protein